MIESFLYSWILSLESWSWFFGTWILKLDSWNQISSWSLKCIWFSLELILWFLKSSSLLSWSVLDFWAFCHHLCYHQNSLNQSWFIMKLASTVSNCDMPEQPVFKLITKRDGPERIRSLLWKMNHECLLTNLRRVCLGIWLDSSCTSGNYWRPCFILSKNYKDVLLVWIQCVTP